MEEVKEIERIIKDRQTIVVEGETYALGNYSLIEDKREVEPLEVSSLTAVCGYINKKLEPIDFDVCFIHVQGYEDVVISSSFNMTSKRRSQYLTAKAMKGVERFEFGKYIPIETFLIQLATLFVDNADKLRLLSFISRVDVSATAILADDGVSQSLTVHSALSGAIKANEKTPSLVILKPFRTFLEIDQPESKFIFRVRKNPSRETEITCALFEADGGVWKQKAVKDIHAWIEKSILPINSIVVVS